MTTSQPARKYHSLRDPRQLEILEKHMNNPETKLFYLDEQKGLVLSLKRFFFYKGKMYYFDEQENKFFFYRASALELKLWQELEFAKNPPPKLPEIKYEPGSMFEAYDLASKLPKAEGDALIAEACKRFGLPPPIHV